MSLVLWETVQMDHRFMLYLGNCSIKNSVDLLKYETEFIIMNEYLRYDHCYNRNICRVFKGQKEHK